MSNAESALTALLEVMARLRDPQRGCRWDLAQDFHTIAPYTIEEAYEVADAIAREDRQDLRAELGDLLFQVVFHARMAQERGWFEFVDVAEAIRDKLERRHPHVFGPDPQPLDGPALERLWEEEKARERAAGNATGEEASTLADVPAALPALTRAAKLGRRASRVGFDWHEPAQVRAQMLAELEELDAALGAGAKDSGAAQPAAQVVEEFGDLLFALVNWGRHLRIDPEAALRAANRKFESRFHHMEALARDRKLNLRELTPEAWEALWRESKEALAARVKSA
jgi:nucleoside triphosphate diphosphatase